MTLGASNTRNALSGSQNPLALDGCKKCINMVRYEVSVSTSICDYDSSKTIIDPKPPPLKTPLHIDYPKPPPPILKGFINFSSHNPNSRATQNYSIVKGLVQTLYVMSYLEVL
jgi:hypothetical protein